MLRLLGRKQKPQTIWGNTQFIEAMEWLHSVGGNINYNRNTAQVSVWIWRGFDELPISVYEKIEKGDHVCAATLDGLRKARKLYEAK